MSNLILSKIKGNLFHLGAVLAVFALSLVGIGNSAGPSSSDEPIFGANVTPSGDVSASEQKNSFSVVNTSTINNGGLVVGYTSPTHRAGHLNIDYNGNLSTSGTLVVQGNLTFNGTCSGTGCGTNFNGRLSGTNIFQVTDGTTTSTLTANALYVATSTGFNLGRFNVTSTGDISTSGSLYFNGVQDVGEPNKARIFLDDSNVLTYNAPVSAAGFHKFKIGDTTIVQVVPNGAGGYLQLVPAGGFYSTPGDNRFGDTGLTLTSGSHFVKTGSINPTGAGGNIEIRAFDNTAIWGGFYNHSFTMGTNTLALANVATASFVTSTNTTTIYAPSDLAGRGGRVIVEDTDGAGCTQIYTLNGVITGEIVTCPN